MKAESFDVQFAAEAQAKLCKENGWPHFAPNDGRCYECKNNIYTKISIESARRSHITGCPHCNRSYCD